MLLGRYLTPVREAGTDCRGGAGCLTPHGKMLPATAGVRHPRSIASSLQRFAARVSDTWSASGLCVLLGRCLTPARDAGTDCRGGAGCLTPHGKMLPPRLVSDTRGALLQACSALQQGCQTPAAARVPDTWAIAIVISTPTPDGWRARHPSPPPLDAGITSKQLPVSAQRTSPHHPKTRMPLSAARAADKGGQENACTVHRSSSATDQDGGSAWAGAPGLRATSMRPRESEGVAEGGDEDDDGAVRRPGAGPQSWARAALTPPPTRGPTTPTKLNP